MKRYTARLMAMFATHAGTAPATTMRLRVIRSWIPTAPPLSTCSTAVCVKRLGSADQTRENAVRKRRGRFRKPPCSRGASGRPPRPPGPPKKIMPTAYGRDPTGPHRDAAPPPPPPPGPPEEDQAAGVRPRPDRSPPRRGPRSSLATGAAARGEEGRSGLEGGLRQQAAQLRREEGRDTLAFVARFVGIAAAACVLDADAPDDARPVAHRDLEHRGRAQQGAVVPRVIRGGALGRAQRDDEGRRAPFELDAEAGEAERVAQLVAHGFARLD